MRPINATTDKTNRWLIALGAAVEYLYTACYPRPNLLHVRRIVQWVRRPFRKKADRYCDCAHDANTAFRYKIFVLLATRCAWCSPYNPMRRLTVHAASTPRSERGQDRGGPPACEGRFFVRDSADGQDSEDIVEMSRTTSIARPDQRRHLNAAGRKVSANKLVPAIRAEVEAIRQGEGDLIERRFALGQFLLQGRQLHRGDREFGRWLAEHELKALVGDSWRAQLLYAAEHEEEVRVVLSGQLESMQHTNWDAAVDAVREAHRMRRRPSKPRTKHTPSKPGDSMGRLVATTKRWLDVDPGRAAEELSEGALSDLRVVREVIDRILALADAT